MNNLFFDLHYFSSRYCPVGSEVHTMCRSDEEALRGYATTQAQLLIALTNRPTRALIWQFSFGHSGRSLEYVSAGDYRTKDKLIVNACPQVRSHIRSLGVNVVGSINLSA